MKLLFYTAIVVILFCFGCNSSEPNVGREQGKSCDKYLGNYDIVSQEDNSWHLKNFSINKAGNFYKVRQELIDGKNGNTVRNDSCLCQCIDGALKNEAYDGSFFSILLDTTTNRLYLSCRSHTASNSFAGCWLSKR